MTDPCNVVLVKFDTQILTSIFFLGFEDDHLLVGESKLNHAIVVDVVLFNLGFLPSLVVVAFVVASVLVAPVGVLMIGTIRVVPALTTVGSTTTPFTTSYTTTAVLTTG